MVHAISFAHVLVVVPDTPTSQLIDKVFIMKFDRYLLCLGSVFYGWLVSGIHHIITPILLTTFICKNKQRIVECYHLFALAIAQPEWITNNDAIGYINIHEYRISP